MQLWALQLLRLAVPLRWTLSPWEQLLGRRPWWRRRGKRATLGSSSLRRHHLLQHSQPLPLAQRSLLLLQLLLLLLRAWPPRTTRRLWLALLLQQLLRNQLLSAVSSAAPCWQCCQLQFSSSCWLLCAQRSAAPQSCSACQQQLQLQPGLSPPTTATPLSLWHWTCPPPLSPQRPLRSSALC